MTVPMPPYPKAPIVEAVMQLEFAAALTNDDQEKISQALADAYPTVTPQQELGVMFDGIGVQIEQKPAGYRRTSWDQADVALIFPQSMAVARLSPYEGWEGLRAAAETVWRQRFRIAKSSEPKRIGVRYINRLDIPFEGTPHISADSYLKLGVTVPDIVGGSMTSYLLQFEMPTKTAHWSMRLSSSLVAPSPVPNHLSVLFDIDLFRTAQLPRKEADLLAVLDEARAIKNDIFEKTITDNARKLFA